MQNLALLITVASLLTDMDKMQMKERLHMDKMNVLDSGKRIMCVNRS